MRDELFDDMSYEELIELTLKEAKVIEETKKKRIIILAKKLENGGTPREMISQKITRDLQGWVNSKYVRDCLGRAYIDLKLVREQNTSQGRGSTPADDSKKLLVNITNKGKQETANDLPTPKEQTIKEFDLGPPSNDIITIESLQDEIRIVKQERDYFARKLGEKSPDFPEMYKEIKQLKEIEKERVKRHDFNMASPPVKNEILDETDKLRKKLSQQDELLAKDTFEAELELREQTIPLIIEINRSAGRATVIVDHAKMKRIR